VAVDAVHGANEYLTPNTTAAAVDDSTFVASFDSDGFTVGTDDRVNASAEQYASWNWLASTTFDPATAGTVTTGSGRSNATAGFSIVKYTSENNAVMTVGHGLSQAPELIIVKSLDVNYNWAVYSSALTSADYSLQLNNNIAETSYDYWDNTNPTASVFTIGTDNGVNDGTDENIAYCFHSVEGYSKIGSYTGNGNADGTFVYTGFRPAWILSKEFNEGGDSWFIRDDKRQGYNEANYYFNSNNNIISTTGDNEIDILSNGWKMRSSNSGTNQSASTYLYLAFSHSPFKTSNAR